ncbi:hypothetical protein BGZ76_009991, partial [Entomortierella beljakovae]
HIFCKACLSSYIQQSCQEHPPQDTQPSTSNLQQRQENVSNAKSRPTITPTREPFKSSMPHKELSVECPGCKRMGGPSKLLPVSLFRPAKFVECGFAVELLCPHHLFGCTFRGAASDIINHLSRCPFSLHDISNTSVESGNSSFPVVKNQAPLSPPQSSPIQPPIAFENHFKHSDMNYHKENQELDGASNNKGFQTPILNSSSEWSDDIDIYQQAQDGDMDDLDAENDLFLERLEELDMTDIPVSPINTPLPAHHTTHPLSKSNPLPSPPTIPARRRRLIVDEESDQSTTAGTEKYGPYNKNRVRSTSEDPTQKRVFANQASNNDNIRTGTGVQSSHVKNRILQDITMSVYASEKETSLRSKTPALEYGGGDMPMNDSALTTTQPKDYQPNQTQSSQHQPQQQEQNGLPPFTQSTSLAGPTGVSNNPEHSSSQQLEEPWIWQANNSDIRSQESLGDMTNITSPVPSTGFLDPGVSSPQPSQNPALFPGSVVMGQQTNLTALFTMSQPSQFFVAEPSSYLPLLVHVPRYLRTRRKKLHRGRSLNKKMTPIVHIAQYSSHQEKNETLTPDITSPENSYLSHNVAGGPDRQQSGERAM